MRGRRPAEEKVVALAEARPFEAAIRRVRESRQGAAVSKADEVAFCLRSYRPRRNPLRLLRGIRGGAVDFLRSAVESLRTQLTPNGLFPAALPCN